MLLKMIRINKQERNKTTNKDKIKKVKIQMSLKMIKIINRVIKMVKIKIVRIKIMRVKIVKITITKKKIP